MLNLTREEPKMESSISDGRPPDRVRVPCGPAIAGSSESVGDWTLRRSLDSTTRSVSVGSIGLGSYSQYRRQTFAIIIAMYAFI